MAESPIAMTRNERPLPATHPRCGGSAGGRGGIRLRVTVPCTAAKGKRASEPRTPAANPIRGPVFLIKECETISPRGSARIVWRGLDHEAVGLKYLPSNLLRPPSSGAYRRSGGSHSRLREELDGWARFSPGGTAQGILLQKLPRRRIKCGANSHLLFREMPHRSQGRSNHAHE